MQYCETTIRPLSILVAALRLVGSMPFRGLDGALPIVGHDASSSAFRSASSATRAVAHARVSQTPRQSYTSVWRRVGDGLISLGV